MDTAQYRGKLLVEWDGKSPTVTLRAPGGYVAAYVRSDHFTKLAPVRVPLLERHPVLTALAVTAALLVLAILIFGWYDVFNALVYGP
jgi:hypothetical protein